MKKMVKYRACSTLLAAAISLTGCSQQVHKSANNQENKTYCSGVLLEEEEPKVDNIGNEIGKENSEMNMEDCEFLQNPYVDVIYDESFDSITIIGKNTKHHQFDQISDECYQQFNRIIQKDNITSLYFWNLDDTFDFSKIDFSNVTELGFENCSGLIDLKENDLSKLKETSFSNCTGTFDGIDTTKKYDILQFFNTPLKIVKPYILGCDLSETQIYWVEDGKKNKNLKSFLECLAENNINMELLSINERNNQDYNGMTAEEFDLLSKLKIKSINVEDEGVKNRLNLDLTLNKSIQDFSLKAYYKPEGKDIIHSELGNIKIRTNNKQFYCNFSYTDITKNTHFSLPNSTWISLDNLECWDISAFDDLSNVSYLWFMEDLGAGLEANIDGAVVYCKDSSHKFIDVYTNETLEPFREYSKFLKYLKMCNRLEKVQTKLNISSKEDSKYEDVISIGDVVNLKDEDTPIYTAPNSNKPTTSYYGTSELRCIRSIALAKDDYEIEVDNMEDYESFTKLGFAVKKYNLVNQYSLNVDGTLTTEAYSDKGGVQLVYTPFNHKK